MPGRRQHGEGSVYYRKDRKQWVAVADLGWRGGKRDRREFTSLILAQALHWLHNIAKRKVAATTWHGSYRQKVTELICPWFDRTVLAGLCEEDIEEWHAHLEAKISRRTGRPLSASTIGQAHRIMSTAIKEAVKRGRLPRNPVSNVTPPAAERPRPEPPSGKEIAVILDRCAAWPNGARWVVALKTGLRQGEALALRWSDVRFADPASVTVRQSAARVQGERVGRTSRLRPSRHSTGWCSPTPTAGRCTRAPTGRTGRTCSLIWGCRVTGCTTAVTPSPRSCSSRARTRGWCRMSWAGRRWR